MKKQLLNLIIDIGNTRTKIALFEGARFLSKKAVVENPIGEIQALRTNRTVKKSIYLATGKVSEEFSVFLKNELNAIELTHETKVPIKNLYGTPKTLGRDRLAEVWLAHRQIFRIRIASSLMPAPASLTIG